MFESESRQSIGYKQDNLEMGQRTFDKKISTLVILSIDGLLAPVVPHREDGLVGHAMTEKVKASLVLVSKTSFHIAVR